METKNNGITGYFLKSGHESDDGEHSLEHGDSLKRPIVDNEAHPEVEALPIDQILQFSDYFAIVMMMLTHMSVQWQAYLVVYANKGEDPYTSLTSDLSLTSTEFSILSGTTFALVGACFNMIFGVLSDKFNRRIMIIVFGIIWSIMTFVQSFAHNFVQLLIPRILMEIFTSSAGPICYSLIADYFSYRYRARAASIFNFGIYLGISCSSLSTLIAGEVGWRNTYKIVSCISLVIAIATFFIKEPKRGKFTTQIEVKSQDNLETRSTWHKIVSDSQEILSNSTFLIICAAMTLRYFGAYCLGFWSAKFYHLVFPDDQDTFSIANVVIVTIAGTSSVYVGGLISDKLEPYFLPTKGMVGGLGSLLCYPLLFIAFVTPTNFWMSICIYFISCFFGEAYVGPNVSMVQAIFPTRLIGSAVAIILLFGGLSGAISTFLLGILSDHYKVDDHPKRSGQLLGIMCGFSLLSCAPLFIWAGYSYRARIMKRSSQ